MLLQIRCFNTRNPIYYEGGAVPSLVHDAEEVITKLMSENMWRWLSCKLSSINGLLAFSLWTVIISISFWAVRCSFMVTLKHNCCWKNWKRCNYMQVYTSRLGGECCIRSISRHTWLSVCAVMILRPANTEVESNLNDIVVSLWTLMSVISVAGFRSLSKTRIFSSTREKFVEEHWNVVGTEEIWEMS